MRGQVAICLEGDRELPKRWNDKNFHDASVATPPHHDWAGRVNGKLICSSTANKNLRRPDMSRFEPGNFFPLLPSLALPGGFHHRHDPGLDGIGQMLPCIDHLTEIVGKNGLGLVYTCYTLFVQRSVFFVFGRCLNLFFGRC